MKDAPPSVRSPGVPNGAIRIDWLREMRSDSPPAEVELVSSSSPVTPQPPRAMQTNEDDALGGGEGYAEEFKEFSDHQLQQKISRCRKNPAHLTASDGGEKLRRFVNRMEKELDRRRAAGPMKVEGAAFSKELSCFNPGKHADLKKAGQRASNPANYQLESRTVSQNITGHKRLNMDCNITDKRRKKRCITSPQKSHFVSSKLISNKLHIEDVTFGSSAKRWGYSKNQTYESQGLSYSHKRKEKKEVVCLDDEDTEPVKLVDIETANKWGVSKIHYPSRTDPETVELTYSDIKCLEPEEYLKSPVINFYIQYLKKSKHRDDLYIFNTYFYSKLEEALSRTDELDPQFSKLRRWWRSVDIFKTPYIILPIHGQMHWSLLIICMPAKETESGPVMLHLDSLGLHSSHEVFGLIGSYLIAEWRHLQDDSSYDIPFSGRIWSCLSRKIDKEKVEVPSQRNDYDCGIFMLYYIDKFIQEAPERWTRESLRMFGRKWFNPEEASGLRERIRALLSDEFQSAPVDDEDSQSGSHSDDRSEGEDTDDDDTLTINS